jgi:hypothetical protein
MLTPFAMQHKVLWQSFLQPINTQFCVLNTRGSLLARTAWSLLATIFDQCQRINKDLDQKRSPKSESYQM